MWGLRTRSWGRVAAFYEPLYRPSRTKARFFAYLRALWPQLSPAEAAADDSDYRHQYLCLV